MPYTSPNQKTVHVHRSPLENNFLGINNESWKAAARMLSGPAFKLYIYFASNKDGFNLALSPKAIQQDIAMPRSTFYDQLNMLESLGYLHADKERKNVYHFYENPLIVPPVFSSSPPSVMDFNDCSSRGIVLPNSGLESTPENIQIYNKSSPKEDYKYILPIEEELESHKAKPPKTFNGFVF